MDREVAQAWVQKALDLASQADALERRADDRYLSLGRVFVWLFEREVPSVLFRQSNEDWIRANFRDRQGHPCSMSWARTLIDQYEAIHKYPALEQLARHGDQQGRTIITRSGAWWAAQTAEWEGWLEEEIGKQLNAGVAPRDATERATGEVNDRVVRLARSNTSRDIKSDLQAKKVESGLTPHGGRQRFEIIRYAVPPEVKEQADKAIQIAMKMDEDAPANPSGTQVVERLAGAVLDAYGAMQSAVEGNSTPLHALIARVAERMPCKKE